MVKSRDEKIQDLRCMKEDLEAVQHGLPDNFPNRDLELLALKQLESLIETLDTAINLHSMKQSDRTAAELRRSRGQH